MPLSRRRRVCDARDGLNTGGNSLAEIERDSRHAAAQEREARNEPSPVVSSIHIDTDPVVPPREDGSEFQIAPMNPKLEQTICEVLNR